ncbi:hypothetical protein PHYSODRAFT_338485 [Phytophthora sojae]|uniref:Uncharacterized protein n=1 Tax=Phytophthora sojae (strain P6497) TaxID=1094619 RepID=G5A4Z8_PHYSP|nr:hypothetical protein PHYSODRAFT_338485 [Phytophthora sojae]EGZ09747.1 hypothetical protein PHYSODRAFT_338485 [Phytophthora sojae]|eukprot:XP_009534608.1 hypothetical protein PHYSODRAFT_338485 [Phytophthora sojae]
MPPKKHAKAQHCDEPVASAATLTSAAVVAAPLSTPTMVTPFGRRSPSIPTPVPMPTSTPMSTTMPDLSSPVAPREKPKHERISSNQEQLEYVSPVKKLKKYLEAHKPRVIDNTNLRTFIASNDMSDPQIRGSVRIQARLLWTAEDDTHRARFLRVYLGDHIMRLWHIIVVQVYQDAQRENTFEANKYLITLSLYDIKKDNPMLPPPGSIVTVVTTKPRIYNDCCQIDSKLHMISTIAPP